jgi:hypothetical protein
MKSPYIYLFPYFTTFYLTCEALCQEKRSNLKKRGKIYKLCALIKVRIVKSSRSESFVLCRSKISGNFCFKSMDLGMFDRFFSSLKTRALIDERRFDMCRSDKNSERYVIAMHIKNVWTNKWMQDPRNNFLQVNYHDPSTQYRKGWGSFKTNRGLNLYYSCRKQRHIAKEFPGRRPSYLCCKVMDHEVLDFPRMNTKLEGMKTKQENPKADPEMEKPQKDSEKVFLQIKETLNECRHVILSKNFKEKECLEARIGDFDIDCCWPLVMKESRKRKKK